MTDLDLLVRAKLDTLVPIPRSAPDWSDVVLRARPSLRRRRLVLALAAALVVLGTAAAVTAALGGFDAWLSGSPGKPAPAAEQQRFVAANGRSWAAFPTSTTLRELIHAVVGDRTYVLYGFRSGNTLCLRLKAVSLGHSAQGCAPVSTLAHSSAPIVVVVGESGFADRYNHPSAEVSFGIAADGVSRVDVQAIDGLHHAVVGGNAYLFVENEPNTGNRVLRISAVGANGRRTDISLGTTFGLPLSVVSSRRPARGPERVQRRIANPTVAWYFRHEPRGLSLKQVKLTPQQRRSVVQQSRGFLRLVKPDPLSDVVLGLTGNLCLLEIDDSGGVSACGPGSAFFAGGPLNMILTGQSGLFTSIAGVAADGVRRVTVFLADGERQAPPLRDNLFTAFVSSEQLPARVVGYDAAGRVVGVQTVGKPFFSVPLAATRDLRPALRVNGLYGAAVVVRVGRQLAFVLGSDADGNILQRQGVLFRATR
jgi:hypothetical protein